MKEIQTSIVPFVESQFPSFYKEEGENFIAFVKAYYEWMEQEGNVLFHTRKFYDYVDVDTTITEFLTNFKSKYLQNFPAPDDITAVRVDTTTAVQSNTLTSNTNSSAYTTSGTDPETNRRVLTKKAVDLYRAKGNQNALNLLFRLLYKEPVNIHLPSNDILKPSDGRWVIAKYIELTITEKNKQMIGQTITGLTSRATAIVEKISRRMVYGNIFDVAYLTNVKGNFLYNEIVTHDGLAVGSPTTLGSVTSVIIDNPGQQFEVGQFVDLISDMSGRQAKARVTKVGTQTGKITYSNPPTDGGYGYTTEAEVFISANVLFYDNKAFNDPGYNNFTQFEVVEQPMSNVPYTASTSAFEDGVLVYGIDASTSPANTTIAAGVILKSFFESTANSGWLLVSNHRVANISITDIVSPTVTGSFEIGEKVYQINPSTLANSAVGYVVAASTSSVSIDVQTGIFVTGRDIRGSNSNCTSSSISLVLYNDTFTNPNISHIITPEYTTISLINGSAVDKTATGKVVDANTNAVGLYEVDGANPFVNSYGNYITGLTSGVIANVGLISQGDPGGFDIGSITDTETIFISTDFIADNNVFDQAYLTLDIDADQYGFPKYPSGNVSTVIETCLSRDALEIGSIASLTNIDPGAENTARPFVRIYEKNIAMHNRSDFTILIENRSKPFVTGEQILQTFPDGAVTLTVADVSGSFNSAIREMLKQERSDGVFVYGELIEKNISGGSGTLRVRVSNTSNTFDTSNVVTGFLSGASADVAGTELTNYFTIAKGRVLSGNSSSMDINRRTFGAAFTRGVPIVGSISGATADVVGAYQIPNSPIIGNNAIIGVSAGVQTGTLQEVEVTDSGYGYYDLEPVTIRYPNNSFIATGYVVMGNEGETGGFYRDTGGFISADKKIQDSDYYQEFSYEVQSSLSLDKYATILKETLQVAGTKLFGKVIKTSSINANVSTYDQTRGAELIVSNNAVSSGFVIGETVTNFANTANGKVTSYNTTMVIDGSNNEIVVGTKIYQPSAQLNQANGTITSVEYNVSSNSTTLELSNVGGVFTATSNVEAQFNRKFIEYSMIEGTLSDGEIVYQSNGSANVGVGDLISSSSSRLVIKPLTEILIASTQGALTSGQEGYQRVDGITNNATGVIFSSNSSYILVGNTRGEFLPGYKIETSTGNASIIGLGGKKDDFTITDKVLLLISDLTTAGFANGETVQQISTGATGTLTLANTTQLHVENVTGTFVASEEVYGETSNTTANILSVLGPFGIIGVTTGAVANVITLESPYTNVSLGVITTINNLKLSNVNGTFATSSNAYGRTSGTVANVETVKVTLY